MAVKFYLCPICGNVVIKVLDSGVNPVCCGKEMVELQPGMTDGDGEKHLPVVECQPGGKVQVEVGLKPHPMLAEHHIMLVVLETERGFHLQRLEPGAMAVATFFIGDEKPVAAYEYCNVHGLWKTPLQCTISKSGCCLAK